MLKQGFWGWFVLGFLGGVFFFFNRHGYCFIAGEESRAQCTFANICGGRAKYTYTVLIIQLLSSCCVHKVVSMSASV